MQSSLLDRIFPPSSPLLPQHDRRRSRSSSSTTPAPASSSRSPSASQSSILRPAPLSASVAYHSDPLLPLKRAAKSLQRTIQSLLDAQSEGLLAGLTSKNAQDDISSNGSLTPTPTMSITTTMRTSTTIPIRQPPQKKISLRGARRGLSRSMHDFAALKQEEEEILQTQVQERESALQTVESYIAKREGIQSEITSISSESGAQSAGHLRADADELDIQIRELENRLFEMKARHRHLIDQAQQLENSVQSKLSSYNASLELLDKDVRQFLARPPIIQPSSGMANSSVNGDLGADSFYALTPQRRTLRMASEHWRLEQQSLTRRKNAVEREKTALQSGGKLWRGVITEIQSFEGDLKAQMQKLSSPSISQLERDEGMRSVLGGMDKTMGVLEERLQEAEEKDWKLLICCIGAELEACREGREMLVDASGLGVGLWDRQEVRQAEEQKNALFNNGDSESALALPDDAFLPHPDAHPDVEPSMTDFGYGSSNTILSTSKTKSTSTADDNGNSNSTTEHDLIPNLAQAPSAPGSRSSESEDDDPGPDFLISHT